MCVGGKVEYKSKQEAWSVKGVINKNHRKANPYKCGLCGKWHLGRG